MKLYSLEAAIPLRKTISERGTEPYPGVLNFTSHEHTVSSLEDFDRVLSHAADQGHCLLKGELNRPLHNESRRGTTTRDGETQWLCGDFDGVLLPSVGQALQQLGLNDVDYIRQHSASAGILPGVRAHIMMMLAEPETPQFLKKFLQYLNFTTPVFADNFELSSTNDSLKWPLDVSVCQNDKLIYVAPPKFIGVDDPLVDEPRIQLIRRNHRVLDLSPWREAVLSFDYNTAKQAKIDELRLGKGLRKRTFKTAFVKKLNTSVVKNPEQAGSYEVKDCYPYMRLNINGGSSWAYWHPAANPEVIYSFKDEDIAYRTSELLPEYYPIAVENAADAQALEAREAEEAQRVPHNGKQHVVFTDADTGRDWIAVYDQDAGHLQMTPCFSMRHIEDFCTLNRIRQPEAIPHWHVTFNPQSTKVLDYDRQTLNLYQPSHYRMNVNTSREARLPEVHRSLMLHVLGDNEEALEVFTQWLAFLLQYGRKPKTAWLLHGGFGTGKGRLFDVLSEVFGAKQCVKWTANRAADQFNAALRTAQILFLDEVTLDNTAFADIDDRLKNMISEPDLPIRAMRTDTQTVPSYMGVIVAANEENPVRIPANDRRWHVPPRQEERLIVSDEVYDAYLDPENLQALTNYLATRSINSDTVMRPELTTAKLDIQNTTTKVPRLLVEKLNAGDFEFLIRQVPLTTELTGVHADLLYAYKKVLAYIFNELSRFPLDTVVPVGLVREELKVVFALVADWGMQGGEKFSTAVARFGMPLHNSLIARHDLSADMRYTGKTFPFRMDEDTKVYYLQHIAKFEEPRLRAAATATPQREARDEDAVYGGGS